MPRGSRSLPDTCVQRLRAADLILHAGDIVAGSFLEELRALGPPVEAVCGNVDEPALKAMLERQLVLELEGARIGMVHAPGPAVGRGEQLVRRFDGCTAIVFGHTHMPVVERWRGIWLLNPGSPTERRRAPTRTMLELRVDAGEIVPTLVDLGA